MLIKVRYIDNTPEDSGGVLYAPPARDGLVNTDHIASVTVVPPSRSRRNEEVCRVMFANGDWIDVLGNRDQFSEKQ